jgi:hypothetical protein
MKTTGRRSFIRKTSVTATGLALASSQFGFIKKQPIYDVIGCGDTMPDDEMGTISSVKSGNWSDADTWGGSLPKRTDTPLVSSGHTVTFDLAETEVAGLYVNGVLLFEQQTNALLKSRENIVVYGLLQMQPANASILHTIKFIGINESKFIGGTMEVVKNDIGLWVMEAGKLDLVGSEKDSWVRCTGSIASGTDKITVSSAKGWRIGDEISIAPTEAPSVGSAFTKGFDETKIKSISGNTITLTEKTKRPHPMVNNQWTAEVMNLTRNVRIEGESTGKAHIFIMSSSKHNVRNVAMRYLGQRKDLGGTKVTEGLLARYALHFHHCKDSSRGTIVDGNVVRDADNHSFVPHWSHGITMSNNIAYNVIETAFWWDPSDPTRDVIYDRNIVAICKFLPGALNRDAENAPNFSSSGFALNKGDGNTLKNCVVVGGGLGDYADGGAFNWEAVIYDGVWAFKDNMAHNNDCGLRVWQNTTRNHVIENFTAYNNSMGIFHGAYANCYRYVGCTLYGNGIKVKAASVNSNRVRFENTTIDGAGAINYGIQVVDSPLAGERPILVRNVSIKNCKIAALIDEAGPEVHSTDVVQCEFGGAIILSPDAASGETIRVQPKTGQTYKITHGGKSNIQPFAAAVWGNGMGLKADYYNDIKFGSLAFSRIDSNISFTEWSSGVHYAITSNIYSVRWTGQIQAQFSETYNFFLNSGGGSRLWINDKLIYDSWVEHYPDRFAATPIALVAGNLYYIKLEYFNANEKSGISLLWSSPSLPLEFVPQSQLFAPAVPNKNPEADAGEAIVITLPTNNVTLDGSRSSDSDGKIASYAWSKISGPSNYTIAKPTAAITTVTGLVKGTYVFQLEVTDDKGAKSSDRVTVTVNEPVKVEPPIADAGDDTVLTLPTNSTTLDGSGSSQTNGKIVSYSWTKISGPASYKITNASAVKTTVTGLVEGTYVFNLLVKDSNGLSGNNNVTITVQNAGPSRMAANAGSDIAISKPASSVTLDGSASTIKNGRIVAYSWSKVSGPANYKISNSNAVTTLVSNLSVGEYVFRLVITDNYGDTQSDKVTVTVSSEPTDASTIVSANAYPNPTTSYFNIKIDALAKFPVEVAIYRITGDLVQRYYRSGGSTNLRVGSDWRPGTYSVVVSQGAARRVLTLIKQ